MESEDGFGESAMTRSTRTYYAPYPNSLLRTWVHPLRHYPLPCKLFR